MKDSIAKKLGRGLAYVQDTVDRVVIFGFRKLQTAGRKKTAENTHPVQKSLKNTASFLGELGTEYFRKYTELKQEDSRKKRK